MLNEIVVHNRFGKGVIAAVEEGHIRIRFENGAGERKFRYPDAFEHFLHFEDAFLEERAQADLASLKNQQELERIEKQSQFEVREEQRRKDQQDFMRRRRKALRERIERETRSGNRQAVSARTRSGAVRRATCV